MNSPRILLLAGRSFHSLQIAKELYKDLDAEIIGMVGSTNAPMAKSRYCDEVVVSDENHSASIKRLCRERSPEYVLPVGQRWVRALDDVRESLPTRTEFTPVSYPYITGGPDVLLLTTSSLIDPIAALLPASPFSAPSLFSSNLRSRFDSVSHSPT